MVNKETLKKYLQQRIEGRNIDEIVLLLVDTSMADFQTLRNHCIVKDFEAMYKMPAVYKTNQSIYDDLCFKWDISYTHLKRIIADKNNRV